MSSPNRWNKMSSGMWALLSARWHAAQTGHQRDRSSLRLQPMGEELRGAPANRRRAPRRSSQSAEAERWWAGSGGLAPQNQRIWSTLYFFSVGWSLHPSCRISAGEEGEKNTPDFFISFSSEYLLTAEATEYSAKMTTTTTFQGISPNGKSSSR